MTRFIIFIIAICLFSNSFACTLILTTEPNVMVGRNMDWSEDMQANLWLFPSGITHGGEDNTLQWTSKYGSLVATVYENIERTTVDGVNEKGLAAHFLSLPESNYGERNTELPGLSVLLWAQFYLDNFKSVSEAIEFTQKNTFQILPYYFTQTHSWINVHLALEDSTGDSAIVEYIDGTPHIYHQKNYTVVANSPTYDKQLSNLTSYQGLGGDKPLPGTTDTVDRFVRASYYVNHLPVAKTSSDEITNMLGILHNVTQPAGMRSNERPIISQTLWRTIIDLTNNIYYFNSETKFYFIWVDVNKLNFKGSVMKLDLINSKELNGDVTEKFRAVT